MRMYLKADYHKRFKKKKKTVKDTWNKGQKKKKGEREDINNPINTEQSQIQN